ncbi:hypothetical protein PIB30_024157 [Stylosanthes scabra]|uniref:Replication protein A 70 kDa DNA-binding subunit B/D first OB fold domain-containing protein n=1 Tax=Stylosanthes scabra TaxID=79078 RepID=A0ABU6X8V7_9FABA|nr:hypothetical protein [Stylosanthes scabra]
MADSFYPLDKISTRRGEWVIKVMVIRIWSGAFKGNKNDDQPLEMLVHDSKGTRIHCSIPKHVVRSFRAILSEGQMFTISSFLVNKNNLWMRNNSHEFRITLLQRSRVVHIMPPSFAFQPFCFRSISSILYAEKLDQNILFDVLAEVIGREDPIDMVTKQGNESKRLALLVEVSEKTTISSPCLEDWWT